MNQMYKIMFIIPRTAFYNQTKSRINSPSYHWLKWDHKWPLIDVRPDLLVVWSVLSISYLCSLDILLSACVRYSSASVIFCCNVYFQDVNVMIVCAMCMVRKEQFIFLLLIFIKNSACENEVIYPLYKVRIQFAQLLAQMHF